MTLKATLSGSYPAPVTLTSVVYANPVTVTGTISLSGPGIDLQAASDWTIVSQGLIEGTDTTGVGVQLTAGGGISNAAGASIIAGRAAIYIANAVGSVSNDGTVTATYGAGIAMQAGGTVANAATGTITGTTAGIDISTGGSVTNFGSIATTGGGTSGGVLLRNGGQVDNAGTGIINANGFGIYIAGASGSVYNSGIIAGAGESGVGFTVSSGASFTNAASGSISGHYSGAFINGSAGTVVNYGFIGSTFGSAIELGAGGQVTVGSLATVSGADSGIVLGGPGTVSNAGHVVATSNNGVYLAAGGDVGNTTGGVIQGYTGVLISFAPGNVYNAGSIASTGNFAVRLNLGGTIVNNAGATISTAEFGAFIYGGAGTVINAGSIGAAGGRDAVLFASGFANRMVVDPGAEFGGNVDGGNTIGATAVSTLELAAGTSAGVYGTLSGVGTSFFNFAAITIDAGAVWYLAGNNSIAAGVTVTNQDQLSVLGSLSNAGSIAGAGAGIVVFGTLSNETSGVISGSLGANLVGPGASLGNAGIIYGSGQYGAALYKGGIVTNIAGGQISGGWGVGVHGGAGTVNNFGTITGITSATQVSLAGIQLADGGYVFNGGTVSGTYGVQLLTGGTVTNAGTIASIGANTIAVQFAPGFTNRLIVDPTAVFAGTVDGGNTVTSSIASTLELAPGTGTLAGIGSNFENFGSIVFDPTATWNIGGDTAGLAGGEIISGFTVGDVIDIAGVNDTVDGFSNGTLSLSGSVPLQLLLPGSFSQSFVANPSDDGTAIILACFLEGTRILTAAGEIEVERLRPGALVFSILHGKLLPITWIGHRKLSIASPVRVCADAFAPGRPHRDLWLSPDHAVYIDGVLVPVRYLVNGATIAQHQCEEVIYYHIELAEHGVLLAEGLPAESYLDTGNRAAFANTGAKVIAHAAA